MGLFLGGLFIGAVITFIVCALLAERAQQPLLARISWLEKHLDGKDTEIARLREVHQSGQHPAMAHALLNAPDLFAAARRQAEIVRPTEPRAPEADGVSQAPGAPVQPWAAGVPWLGTIRPSIPRDDTVLLEAIEVLRRAQDAAATGPDYDAAVWAERNRALWFSCETRDEIRQLMRDWELYS